MSPGPDQAFFTSKRDSGNEALRVTAKGFTDWGIGVYTPLDIDGVGDSLGAYDLVGRGYDAVRFWAKKETEEDSTTLGVLIADEASTLESEGGTCPAATCEYDHAHAGVNLTTEWQEYTLLLSNFVRGWTSDPIDLSKAYQFHVVQESESVDFWIDDIRFVDLDSSGEGGG
jgi:hypothetical protein